MSGSPPGDDERLDGGEASFGSTVCTHFPCLRRNSFNAVEAPSGIYWPQQLLRVQNYAE